jgi:hypothetical protein
MDRYDLESMTKTGSRIPVAAGVSVFRQRSKTCLACGAEPLSVAMLNNKITDDGMTRAWLHPEYLRGMSRHRTSSSVIQAR